jgi:glycosyltransferase involved in cell wall biosynthesis
VIEAIGVVVPAHDEETLLPACLMALRQAADAVSIPVHVVVVADTCTDRTGATARACGAEVISIRARNVGTARAAGMTGLLRLTAGHDPAVTWLATTDADTVVPSGWLRRQLEYADAGWDVVPGPYPSPTGTGIRRTFRTRSSGATRSAPGRTRTYTARTSVSGPPPTWRPTGSRRYAPPRTTPCSSPRPRLAARSCRPVTSRWRPHPGGTRARRTGSAICCVRWPADRIWSRGTCVVWPAAGR